MSSWQKQEGQTVGQAKPMLAYYKATPNNDTLSERKTSGVNAIPDWAPNSKREAMISLITTTATSMATQNRKTRGL